jgi:hypothetical protein
MVSDESIGRGTSEPGAKQRKMEFAYTKEHVEAFHVVLFRLQDLLRDVTSVVDVLHLLAYGPCKPLDADHSLHERVYLSCVRRRVYRCVSYYHQSATTVKPNLPSDRRRAQMARSRAVQELPTGRFHSRARRSSSPSSEAERLPSVVIAEERGI